MKSINKAQETHMKHKGKTYEKHTYEKPTKNMKNIANAQQKHTGTQQQHGKHIAKTIKSCKNTPCGGG